MMQVTAPMQKLKTLSSTLTEFFQLCGMLLRHLVGMGVKNFKVMDTCCTTNCTSTANTAKRLSELQKVTEKDGIHNMTATKTWQIDGRHVKKLC
jgi:hypothetical protein